jgi:hypothetical protein
VPAGVKPPSEDDLAQCERANRDGGGIAWVEGAHVKWAKGIELKEMRPVLEAFKNGSPGMFIHFRIATAGGRTEELCHPFPVTRRAETDVTGKAKKVMMHNGTLRQWKELMLHTLRSKLPPGQWSDTRAMAYMAAQFGDGVFEFLDEKIATLDHTGRIDYYGSWHKHEGSYFSNMHWLRSGSITVGQYTGGKYRQHDYWPETWSEYHESRYGNKKSKKEERQTSFDHARSVQRDDKTGQMVLAQETPKPAEVTAPVADEPTRPNVIVPPAIQQLTTAEKEQFLPGWSEIAKEFDEETADAFLAEEIAEMEATPPMTQVSDMQVVGTTR